MPDATLTPDRAPDHIEGLSTDVRACVLLDAEGRLAAVDTGHEQVGERLAELGRDLLTRAEAPQIEVSTGTGIVYALRAGDWALVAVTGRFALSSLVFFDMREALEALTP
jgi:hypothetical protein